MLLIELHLKLIKYAACGVVGSYVFTLGRLAITPLSWEFNVHVHNICVQARERQRREEQERLEREAAEAERLRKEEEEARERAAQEAAEKQAALAKLRQQKAQSLGEEPEKGPNVTRVMFIKAELVF